MFELDKHAKQAREFRTESRRLLISHTQKSDEKSSSDRVAFCVPRGLRVLNVGQIPAFCRRRFNVSIYYYCHYYTIIIRKADVPSPRPVSMNKFSIVPTDPEGAKVHWNVTVGVKTSMVFHGRVSYGKPSSSNFAQSKIRRKIIFGWSRVLCATRSTRFKCRPNSSLLLAVVRWVTWHHSPCSFIYIVITIRRYHEKLVFHRHVRTRLINTPSFRLTPKVPKYVKTWQLS